MKNSSRFICWIFTVFLVLSNVCTSAAPPLRSSRPASSSQPAGFAWKSSDHRRLQWIRLTNENFTSDIKQHPFVLCIATVPWCGESRSIMGELLKLIETDKALKQILQLRVVYVNLDKDLGFTLSGKRKSPILTLYRHAMPYRYKGKLKVHNILAGIHHGTSMSFEDLPFRRLHSFSEMENFMLFTDKAVILFDFCNWAQKIGQKTKRSAQEDHAICKDVPFWSIWQDEVEAKKGIRIESLNSAGSQKHRKKTTDAQKQAVSSPRCKDVQKRTNKVEKTKISFRQDDNSQHTISNAAQMCALYDQQKLDNDNFLAGAKSNSCSSNMVEKKDVLPDLTVAGDTEMSNSGLQDISLMENQLGSESGVHHLCLGCESQTVCSTCKSSIFENNLNSAVLMVSNHADQFGDCDRIGFIRQGQCCNQTENQQFTTVYRNLTKIARSHVLTPERAKFGIVTDKSLLSDLKIASMQNFSWFLMMQVLDQSYDPVFYFGDGGVDSFIFGQPLQLVPELDSELSDYPSSFSNVTPSLVVFIDRASPSPEVCRKSWEALRAIQVVAREYIGSEKLEAPDLVDRDKNQEQYQMRKDGIGFIKTDISTQMQHNILDSEELQGLLASGLQVSTVAGSITNLRELMSKNYNPRSESGEKHSGVFLQILLGGEGNMKIEASLEDGLSDHVLASDPSRKVVSGNNAVVDDFTLDDSDNAGARTFMDPEDNSARDLEGDDSTDKTEHDSSFDLNLSHDRVVREQKSFNDKLTRENELLGLDKIHKGLDTENDGYVEDLKVTNDMQMSEPTLFSGNTKQDNPEELEQVLSFFFVDGDDRLKDMILPNFAYPSIVILDPFEGGQYLFPFNQSISQLSLREFVNSFAKNSLHKTYNSETTPKRPKKHLPPPFVNRDFHEVNGVPQVTVDTFQQMVLGSNVRQNLSHSKSHETLDIHKDEIGLAWKKDVLVHFTAPWCGFCKRMELVFREVHRMLKQTLEGSVGKISVEQSTHVQSMTQGNMQSQDGQLLEGLRADKAKFDTEDDLPILAQMDCTGNDCSGLLKGIAQEELYPSVILFPARRKDCPILFEGGPTVYEILEFLVAKGTAATEILHRVQEHTWKKRSSANLLRKGHSFPSLSSKRIQIDSTVGDVRPVYDFTAEAANEQLPAGEHPMSSVVLGDSDSPRTIIYPTVGSVLVATEKLSTSSAVFGNSTILIVKADGMEGFQGLIVNKPLLWKLIPGLDSEMEPLVNKTVLCYGGPVIMHGQPFLSLTRLKDFKGFVEVVPGIHFGGPAVTRNVFQSIKDGTVDASNFWFFLGHAVWSWQQLLDELSGQVWQLSSYREGLIDLPVQEWLDGANIRVSDLPGRKKK